MNPLAVIGIVAGIAAIVGSIILSVEILRLYVEKHTKPYVDDHDFDSFIAGQVEDQRELMR